jgi:hypothetical protein
MNTIALKENIELPNNFDKYPNETQKLIIEYLNSLDKFELIAYNIGKSHLGSSFNIVKSNGYCDWLKSKK